MRTWLLLLLGIAECAALYCVHRLWFRSDRYGALTKIFWSAVLLVPVVGIGAYEAVDWNYHVRGDPEEYAKWRARVISRIPAKLRCLLGMHKWIETEAECVYCRKKPRNASPEDEKSFARAVLDGELATVRILIKRFPLIAFHKDIHGGSGLHFLFRYNYTWQLHVPSLEVAHFLVTHGCNVNTVDNEGNTPLHKVHVGGPDADVPRHECRIMGFLLENGALVNARNKQGRTPLHGSAIAHHSNQARVLLSCGADPQIKDDDGQTAIEYAYADQSRNREWIDMYHMTVHRPHLERRRD